MYSSYLTPKPHLYQYLNVQHNKRANLSPHKRSNTAKTLSDQYNYIYFIIFQLILLFKKRYTLVFH